MLLSLAWRNIWRNKKRSLIILVSIAFGLWGGLFAGAVMMGMGESIIDSAIERNLAHIQIHHPQFSLDKDINLSVKDGVHRVRQIRAIPGVEAVSGRTIIEGMAASPTSSAGVMIVGVVPQDMGVVTSMSDKIVAGDFFETQYKRSIIIGQKLASTLNLKVRNKIVLSFQGLDGNIIYHAARVVGIYKTEANTFDGAYVFLPRDQLLDVLGSEPMVHEIAIRISSGEEVLPILEDLKTRYPEALIQTWKDIAPEIAFLSQVMEQFSYVFVAIILFALLFGIINTMLMSVIDRIREFGMLMAVGMKKRRVFGLIILETIFLSVTGGVVAILVSAGTVSYFGSRGIDLSYFSHSLASFGMNTMLYPFLPSAMYVGIVLMIIIAANLAGLFPAYKAVRIEPSEALRVY